MSLTRPTIRTVAGTAAALASVAVLSACGQDVPYNPVSSTEHSSSPVEATRNFVTEAVVDNDGILACGYMTTAQRRAASNRADGECAQAFYGAGLTLGGQHVNTLTKVDHLKAHSTVSGNRATVTLSRRNDSLDFHLVKVDAAEQAAQFQPPGTKWRIAAGASRVEITKP